MAALKALAEQVIVITGASSGIGLTTARMAAKAGAAVVAVARNEEALRGLVEEIEAAGGRAAYVVCDVGQEGDVARVGAAAERVFGGFDTWVNNAGISIFGRLWDVPLAEWHRMFDTVYWGTVHGSLAALRYYRAANKPGAIVNIGSLFGDKAPAVQSSYASAKFAVHGLTGALRQEIEHEGWPISVSLIHPGRIDTPYNEHAGNFMPMQPVHRGMIYSPEAVAEAILWCAAHRKRDMFVGSQAKLAAMVGAIAPRLTDKVMETLMFTSQQSRTRVSDDDHRRALFSPGYGGHERGTHEPHLLRGSSLYVKATKRPALTAAALVGSGVLAWRWWHRRDASAPDVPPPEAGDMAQLTPAATTQAPAAIHA
ncbi:SDR family oxidoreductase [Sphingomonas sp. BK580]|uniref:SDR family oxidoreductase n=1 Tax=Sphingomonas sp. BK580 TaxID=2586972 RepID=UPI00161A47CB|nr:SDR family oxidoreductase [Sphingomonas sp. BK580]MBB3691425.1 NAD(P)-dependent dehydrogenase (short-subunit alcohol dehydrogenase family) [Sphingomonas sp. BK580]